MAWSSGEKGCMRLVRKHQPITVPGGRLRVNRGILRVVRSRKSLESLTFSYLGSPGPGFSIPPASTIEGVAREWLEKFSGAWAASHAETVVHRLERDIFP